MSFLQSIVGGQVAQPIEAIGNVFDKLFTSDDERAHAEAVMEKLRQQPGILQAEINKIEAGHRSLFVAGWRPFIGWVGGVSLWWHFMGYDLAAWVQAAFFPDAPNPPALNGTEQLITIVLALLGLGAYRTVEKALGRSK